ncbi:hypothetical protein [Streptomyces sp. NBC_01233]|uniref:hypothetical protein n=1 Tax=Streptomyces sp. NBC_01233 TaxID=2903787 RepID=UPI002E14E131|nr:hypothetical protein OG332_09570 [Streptomyces sp. NBC_01233]
MSAEEEFSPEEFRNLVLVGWAVMQAKKRLDENVYADPDSRTADAILVALPSLFTALDQAVERALTQNVDDLRMIEEGASDGESFGSGPHSSGHVLAEGEFHQGRPSAEQYKHG